MKFLLDIKSRPAFVVVSLQSGYSITLVICFQGGGGNAVAGLGLQVRDLIGTYVMMARAPVELQLDQIR